MTKTARSLKVAFQMDPMETVNIDGDTTFALAEVAQARGMEMFEYAPEHLSYNEGRIEAYARPMTVRREQGNHVRFGERHGGASTRAAKGRHACGQ